MDKWNGLMTKCESKDVIDAVAASMMAYEDLDDGAFDDGNLLASNVSRGIRMFRQIATGIEEDSKDNPWINGQHYGDCTGVPMSCNRCIVEDLRKRAKEALIND